MDHSYDLHRRASRHAKVTAEYFQCWVDMHCNGMSPALKTQLVNGVFQTKINQVIRAPHRSYPFFGYVFKRLLQQYDPVSCHNHIALYFPTGILDSYIASGEKWDPLWNIIKCHS